MNVHHDYFLPRIILYMKLPMNFLSLDDIVGEKRLVTIDARDRDARDFEGA